MKGPTLGKLIASLDDPVVALDLVTALGQPALTRRLTTAAEAADRPVTEILSGTVRRFLDTASDETWVQLMGIMNRAQDPGLAALGAILANALPETKE